jgi:hypothetical protein
MNALQTPYLIWDYDPTEADIRAALRGDDEEQKAWIVARLLESARYEGPRAAGDVILWFAYPKGTSKKYKCDFNRDTGWAALGAAGFEPVRMVAIDDDWSALRFRRVEYIQSLKRDSSWLYTQEGKMRKTKETT